VTWSSSFSTNTTLDLTSPLIPLAATQLHSPPTPGFMRWNCERSKTYVRFSKSSSPPYGCIEANLNDDSCLRVFDSEVEVSTNGRSKIMNFERCFDESTNNHQVYMKAIQPLLHQCLRGVDGTIFTCEFPLTVSERYDSDQQMVSRRQ
jgi:hypothetical protein